MKLIIVVLMSFMWSSFSFAESQNDCDKSWQRYVKSYPIGKKTFFEGSETSFKSVVLDGETQKFQTDFTVKLTKTVFKHENDKVFIAMEFQFTDSVSSKVTKSDELVEVTSKEIIDACNDEKKAPGTQEQGLLVVNGKYYITKIYKNKYETKKEKSYSKTSVEFGTLAIPSCGGDYEMLVSYKKQSKTNILGKLIVNKKRDYKLTGCKLP